MKHLKGYLFIIGAACFWGAAATLAKFLLNKQMDPLLLVQARVSFSFVVLLVVLAIVSPGSLHIKLADFGYFTLLGVVGLAGANITYYVTIRESSVATAITIQYTAPLFVMAYEILRQEEEFTTAKLIAAVLALAGCILVVTGFDFSVIHISTLGLLTGFGSIITFSILTVVTRHLLVRYSMWTVTFYSIAFASVFWLLVNAPRTAQIGNVSFDSWTALFVLAMVSVLIPNLLFAAGLRSVVPSRAVITSTLEPVVAIATAAVFVGEKIGGAQIVGAGLVIGAIILLQLRREENEEIVLSEDRETDVQK
jgi:drug/metabolite transporter, DME family